MFDIDKEVARIRTYANQFYDQDTRVSAGLEMQQSAELLANEYHAAVAYMKPEILSLGTAKVKQFLSSDPRLGTHAHFLDDILRMEAHTLSPNEELVIAQAGQLMAAPESIHTILSNADLPYPEVVLSTGEKVRLDASAFTMHRASAVRADRDRVFEAFWGAYDGFRRTFGVALYAQVNAHIFTKNARKYGSCLEASLDRNRIPRRSRPDDQRTVPGCHEGDEPGDGRDRGHPVTQIAAGYLRIDIWLSITSITCWMRRNYGQRSPGSEGAEGSGFRGFEPTAAQASLISPQRLRQIRV